MFIFVDSVCKKISFFSTSIENIPSSNCTFPFIGSVYIGNFLAPKTGSAYLQIRRASTSEIKSI